MNAARALTALLAVLSTTCVATVQPEIKTHVGERPAVGVVAEARVGGVIYEKFDYQLMQAWRLLEPFARDYNWCVGCSINVPAGTVLLPGTSLAREEICTPPMAISRFIEQPVCFERPATDGKLVTFRVPGAFGVWLDVIPPRGVEETEVFDGSRGFKNELVYQGVAGDVLRLLYREFVDDLARPAFHQELTYTVVPGSATEVVFRNLTLEVIEAGNATIRYRVIHGL